MFSLQSPMFTSALSAIRWPQRPNFRVCMLFISLALVAGASPSFAQGQSTSPNTGQSQQPAAQTPDNGKPKQDAPPEAGGPGADSGPYAVPKKKEETPPPAPPPAAAKKIEGPSDYSLKGNVPPVN